MPFNSLASNTLAGRSIARSIATGRRSDSLQYWQRQASVFGSSLIQQLPLTPEYLATDKSGAGRNGNAVAVTFDNAPGPFGVNAPLFDGLTGYVSLYSASLVSAFNGAEGTATIWFKMFDAAAWADGVTRRLFYLSSDAANNQIYVGKVNTTNNMLDFRIRAGGSDNRITPMDQNSLLWRMYTITWSRAANNVAFYINDGQIYQAGGYGVWSGNLNANLTNIGPLSVVDPSTSAHGWMMYWALGNRALTPVEVASLYANPT
jgi:hypothetical protein